MGDFYVLHSLPPLFLFVGSKTIRELAMLSATVPSVCGSPHYQEAARVQLKRLLISQKSTDGHNTAYITQFANAIDNSTMPSWVISAEKTAASIVKATTVTHVPRGGRGGGRGSRGDRGGRGRRGNKETKATYHSFVITKGLLYLYLYF